MLLPFCSARAAQKAEVVSEIVIDGILRIEPETVMTYLTINKGDAVTDDKLDACLKSLFSTGLFADVNLTLDNGVLTVKVVENPIVGRIAFEGNKKIKSQQLKDEISLRPRSLHHPHAPCPHCLRGVQNDHGRWVQSGSYPQNSEVGWTQNGMRG